MKHTSFVGLLFITFASFARAAEPGAPAPSLSAAGVWLNGGRAPVRAELEGRPTILYFWSFDCSRCLAHLSDLQRLEAGSEGPTLFIGAHSGRTPREKDARAVRDAVIGLGLSDRVADDGDGRLADAYKVKVLPTTFLVAPDGKVAARWNGGARLDDVRAELARVRAEFSRSEALAKTRAETPVLERDSVKHAGPLEWPQGLAASDDSLFVSDTGRNRVLEVAESGKVTAVFGSGARGYADGPADSAMFDRPGALAYDSGRLLVAERGNGLIRSIDVKARTTASLHLEAIRFPTGVAEHGADVFAAAPASDRLYWRPRRSLTFSAFAGTGERAERDGLLPAAAFSEPWALAVSSHTLFVADAGSAAVRAIDLDGAQVRTAVAGPPLARPSALAVLDGKLYVADSETGSVFRLDAQLAQVATGLESPSALTAFKGALYAAEPGRGRVVRIDPASGAISELKLRAVPALPDAPPEPPLPAAETVEAANVKVKAAAPAVLRLEAKLPQGWILDPRSRLRWRVAEAAGPIKLEPATRKGTRIPPKLPVEVRFEAAQGRSELVLEADFFYCRADRKGATRARSVRLPVVIEAGSDVKEKKADVLITAD